MIHLRSTSEMKETGIVWIGKIPIDWDIMPAGGVFDEVKEKNKNLKYLNPLSFKYGEIVDKDIKGDVDEDVKETISTYTVVHPNTIMINSLNLNYDFISQRVAIVRKDGVITSAYLAVKPDEEIINPKFVLYLLKSYDAQQVFHGMGSGVRKTLKFQDFKHVFVVAPTLKEQQAIANYLDERCSIIDEIISEATASIEEYKELKQAVIFESVTKGLDKNVPMKDSGVEWIGDIPVSWTYFKLRYVVDDIGDIDHYMPESVMCGIPYVMTGDLKDIASEIEFDSCKQVSYEDYIRLSKKISVNKGDVIFARYASIGVICYVDIDKDFLVSYSCVTIKPKHDLIDGWFLKYYLQSSAFKEEVMRYANSNVQANVGKESMYQAKIALPSMGEQKEIVNYLDIKVGAIESLISEKQALIDDLQMYKNSLIYEVVTGKRRVSDVN